MKPHACFRCGAGKDDLAESCGRCGAAPKSEGDIAASAILSEQVLGEHFLTIFSRVISEHGPVAMKDHDCETVAEVMVGAFLTNKSAATTMLGSLMMGRMTRRQRLAAESIKRALEQAPGENGHYRLTVALVLILGLTIGLLLALLLAVTQRH